MPFVDALDSVELHYKFVEDGELMCFSRTLSQTGEYMLDIVNMLVEGVNN